MSRKDRNFKRFFRPKLGDLKKKKKKKKKKSSPKFRVIFRPKSKIQTFFPPKIRWSPKKKKGLRQNSEWFFGRNPKFKRFFRPKLGDLQKKKRSSPKIRAIFLPISQVQTYEGGWFRMGGAIFHFSQKIGLKSTKNMRLYILHKPMGGARAPPPPPPPLATPLVDSDDQHHQKWWSYKWCLHYNTINFMINTKKIWSYSQFRNYYVTTTENEQWRQKLNQV